MCSASILLGLKGKCYLYHFTNGATIALTFAWFQWSLTTMLRVVAIVISMAIPDSCLFDWSGYLDVLPLHPVI